MAVLTNLIIVINLNEFVSRKQVSNCPFQNYFCCQCHHIVCKGCTVSWFLFMKAYQLIYYMKQVSNFKISVTIPLRNSKLQSLRYMQLWHLSSCCLIMLAQHDQLVCSSFFCCLVAVVVLVELMTGWKPVVHKYKYSI